MKLKIINADLSDIPSIFTYLCSRKNEFSLFAQSADAIRRHRENLTAGRMGWKKQEKNGNKQFYPDKSNMKKVLATLILMVGFCCVASAQLPSVTLKNIDGKIVKTDTLSNNGKPFIIDFFATWCKPCNRELSAISEVYEDWQAETGVKVIAVSIDQAQNINKVKPLVDNHGWQYEVLLDPNSDFKRALGVQMIPYTLIVDGNGKIVYKHNGYVDGAEEELIEKVRELVK